MVCDVIFQSEMYIRYLTLISRGNKLWSFQLKSKNVRENT